MGAKRTSPSIEKETLVLKQFFSGFLFIYFNYLRIGCFCVLVSFVQVGLGGLGVTVRLEIQGFAGSILADEFIQDVKILSISPPGGTLR